MIVDTKVVKSIAELAQLEILPAELPEYVQSLGNVLNLVEQMQVVDTDGIEPMSNPLDGVQRLRSDTVTESNQRAFFQEARFDVGVGECVDSSQQCRDSRQ